MFKVRDKENGKVRTIYAVREFNGEVQFLYYNEVKKDWIWCFASWFEPVKLDNLDAENYK